MTDQKVFYSYVHLRLTRKRALQLGLLRCVCGYPENNHFEHGTRPCAHSDCKEYRERGVSGVEIVDAPKPESNAEQVVQRHRRQIELSPGVGSDTQAYGIAVCDDILNDLRVAGLGAVTPTSIFASAQRAQGGDVPAPTPSAWLWRCKPHCDWPKWSVSIQRPAGAGHLHAPRSPNYEDIPLYRLDATSLTGEPK
jgi:hypothetical protein